LRGGPEKNVQGNTSDWYKAKYYILFMLLASSFFTLQIAGIMDPISLLIRSFSLSVYPLLTYGIAERLMHLQHKHPGLAAISESIYAF
jgi:hypothetical protein